MLEKYEDVVVVDNVVPDSPAAVTDIRKVRLHVCCRLFYVKLGQGVINTTLCDFDFRQVDGFLRVFQFPPPIKLTFHNIAEIVLKVVLNTINQH